jgi:hypothetical protein
LKRGALYVIDIVQTLPAMQSMIDWDTGAHREGGGCIPFGGDDEVALTGFGSREGLQFREIGITLVVLRKQI